MGTWLKHDVITVVNAPLENVWNTWSDLDSMEGATMSGHLAAAAILEKKAELAKNLAVS